MEKTIYKEKSMKKLTQMNLDIYIFLQEFEKEHGYCPSYREIQETTNYKSVSSVKQAIDKLEDIGMITTARDENGVVLARTIKVVDNEETRERIKKLRESMK
jgi:SOS-response transcriptional repressor LexA